MMPFEHNFREIFPELPLWTFEIQEVSPSVYQITGRDLDGRSVATTGTNIQEMVDQLKIDAARIQRDTPTR